MREIKYRAWVKRIFDKDIKGMMVDVNEIYFGRGDIGYSCYCERYDRTVNLLAKKGNFELLQWTGLCDRNGTKIYEGDIISFRKSTITGGFAKKNVGEVIKINGCFKAGYSWFHWFNCFDELIILGNKFENPELLEGE